MATDKDTIYVDIDDEITGIIDKVKASDGKVVALVLPKRASVFQSIVNMKLLKRAADGANKNLALITTEAGLLPLAGAAGIHVAKTLTSKPEIPMGPQGIEDTEESVDEAEAETLPDEQPLDADKSVGELAGPAAAGAAAGAAASDMETVELDNEDLPTADEAAKGAAAAKPAKSAANQAKKDKKLKIPNFNRFRMVLALLALVLALIIIGVLWATFSLNKATINIQTDATNVNTSQDMTLSTAAKALDSANNTVPAKYETLQKTYSQQVPTTGQKNTGNKANGTINMSGQTCGSIPNGDPADVPAGTGVSANGQTYITQQDTSFTYSGPPNHGCLPFKSNNSTPITAQSPGANSNTPGGTSFSVAGRSDVNATGSASGGSDNIVQSVNQNDINTAKSKISANDSAAKQSLINQIKSDGYYPITATFNTGTPTITSSPGVGQVGNSVTVTETINYSMFGAHKADLQSLIDSNVQTQIDSSQQSILDDGLDNANVTVNGQTPTSATITMATTAVVGPQLDVNSIKSAAAGQKAGAIKGQLSSNPDVKNVKVSFSPFWITTAPKKTDRITVKIAKPTTTKSSNSNGSNP